MDNTAQNTALDSATYYASGSNRTGEIRGLEEIGHPIGATAPEVLKGDQAAVRELEASTVPVFLDSGAFSEVGKDLQLVPDKEILPAAWRVRLDLYERLGHSLGRRLAVVAPDRVGSQDVTLERLVEYREELQAIARTGAEILIPLQRGEMSAVLFWIEAKRAAGVTLIPAFPMAKGATPAEDVVAFCDHMKPPAIHLLGLGPKSQRIDSAALLEAIRAASPATHVRMDSCRIAATTGRRNGPGGGPRALTIAQDAAREDLWAESYYGTEAPGAMGCAGDYTDAIGFPSDWMSRSQIKAVEAFLLALYGEEAAASWADDPDAFDSDPIVDVEIDRHWTARAAKLQGPEVKRRAVRETFSEDGPACPSCEEPLDDFNPSGLDVQRSEDGRSWVSWAPHCVAVQEDVAAHGWEAVWGLGLLRTLELEVGVAARECYVEEDSLLRFSLETERAAGSDQRQIFQDIDAHHLHHQRPVGWKFGVTVHNGPARVGVAVVGRPVSRVLASRDPGLLEITRVCTWGDPRLRHNAASALLGKACKEAKKAGATRVITYTLQEESGASLRAAGFRPVAFTRGKSWSTKSRPRTDKHPTTHKTRWERVLVGAPKAPRQLGLPLPPPKKARPAPPPVDCGTCGKPSGEAELHRERFGHYPPETPAKDRHLHAEDCSLPLTTFRQEQPTQDGQVMLGLGPFPSVYWRCCTDCLCALYPAGDQRRPIPSVPKALQGARFAAWGARRVLVHLLGRPGSRKGLAARRWHQMTPQRYAEAVTLLDWRVPPEAVKGAIDRIHASRWVDRSAHEVTQEDLDRLQEERPWELTTRKQTKYAGKRDTYRGNATGLDPKYRPEDLEALLAISRAA